MLVLLFVELESAQKTPVTNQVKVVRDTSRFTPCKVTVKVRPRSKKKLLKILFAGIPSCTLKLVPLLGKNWGTPERLLEFVPRAKYVTCLFVRIIYGYYTDANGFLPHRLTLNASAMYDLAWEMLRYGLNDHSNTAYYCARRTQRRPESRNCFPKKQLLEAAELIVPCGRDVLGGFAPEQGELIIQSMDVALQYFLSNGFLNYLCN